jgi:hypothetical protein
MPKLSVNQHGFYTVSKHIARLEEIRKQSVPLSRALKSEGEFGTGVFRTASHQSNADREKYLWPLIASSYDSMDQYFQPLKSGWFRVRYGWKGSYQNYQTYIDQIVQITSLPYAQGSKLAEPSIAKDDYLSQIGIPNFQRAYIATTITEADQQLLFAWLGIQAYQQEHAGKLPADLATLVREGYLKTVPTDPFSPNADSPLAYDAQTGKVTAQMPKNFGGMPKSPQDYRAE